MKWLASFIPGGWLFTLIGGLFKGGLGGVIGAVGGIIGKLSDNDTARISAAISGETSISVAGIQAFASVYHDRAAMLAGFKITQFLIVAAIGPAIYHQALVMLDSCPFFLVPYFAHAQGSWHVAPLPGAYADHEWALIGSLLGIQTGLFGIGAFARYLHK